MKKKLLLADDSITIQKVVGIIFATEDYELLTASDGDKAFELALLHKPDLVIADIVMPGKNGFDLCREIKSHPELGATSVLLLPGAFEEFDETRAVEVCADGWLTKPFESQALLDKVTALFEMPPLRLAVAAAESEVADEAPEGEDFAAQPAASDAGKPFATSEESSFDLEEPATDMADEVVESTGLEEDTDGELWGEVSFEEEDLKPQDLLAAGDEDEEEPADDSPGESDWSEPSQGLTPEQLAPYVSTPPAVTPSEDAGTPEFEPLADETKEEFEFVTDQPVNEEEAQTETEEATFGAVDEPDEPPAAFEFETQNKLEADNRFDNTIAGDDDAIELMEEDLDQEEELVEDSATFIDLSADEEEGEDDVVADEEPFAFDADDDTSDNEILDLTEGDILEEDETLVAVSDETPASEAVDTEHDNLFVVPQDQGTDQEDVIEESVGRHDDGLFVDEDESIPAIEKDDEPVAGTSADYETEVEESDFVEVQSGASAEPEEMAEPEKIAEVADAEEIVDPEDVVDTEEMVAKADDFAASTFDVPPSAGSDVLSSSEMVEEQLRQLPEAEVARIVEKVAGPLIERLAREMLEQTVWEVVPDLAETMIRAEIEKIKRGES